MDDDDTPYCADGCKRPATTERLEDVIIGLDGELYEVVALVCTECERVTA